ncbi:MAG: efflux RND transporter periplasmic adaptor subunit [Planctomycetota bacterium]|jgi:Cu(I)/Ag(I) efflux system membrane fusion protein
MTNTEEKNLFSRLQIKWILLAVVFIVAFFLGYILHGKSGAVEENQQANVQQSELWTCSMHPEVQLPKPGKCPKCFMDLIPVVGDISLELGERQISFSKEALKLMELQTAVVERKFVEAKIPMVGKVDYDETKLKHITAWVPGRIDRLYVDFTGTQVIKDDHMVYLYSPDLISAQVEFLQAVKAVENMSSESSELIKRSIEATLEAAREKLRLLGLTKEQIEEIATSGEPTDHVTITAPIGGVVIDKHATEGMYVQTGSPIYTIADLSEVWVKLDVYEADMMWVRYGQEVEFTTEAYPGEVFKGKITFIPPTLDAKTRTVKLRVNVPNLDGKLKPEMFVRAVVRSNIAAGGMVMDEDMAGKWICPMHPSIVKEGAGECDICQMDLVTAESLGYVEAEVAEQPPLVIPASAPLITGQRAVVYVQVPGMDKPTFEGRQIVLGPKAGNYYLVQKGLVEGETVVTNGNFKIDSALQIQAKPSMMGSKGGVAAVGHQHGDTHQVDDTPTQGQAAIKQTHCPVMDGLINEQYFTVYKGKKVYFCCPGCDEEFLKNPEKYISKLPQFNN